MCACTHVETLVDALFVFTVRRISDVCHNLSTLTCLWVVLIRNVVACCALCAQPADSHRRNNRQTVVGRGWGGEPLVTNHRDDASEKVF